MYRAFRPASSPAFRVANDPPRPASRVRGTYIHIAVRAAFIYLIQYFVSYSVAPAAFSAISRGKRENELVAADAAVDDDEDDAVDAHDSLGARITDWI